MPGILGWRSQAEALEARRSMLCYKGGWDQEGSRGDGVKRASEAGGTQGISMAVIWPVNGA